MDEEIEVEGEEKDGLKSRSHSSFPSFLQFLKAAKKRLFIVLKGRKGREDFSISNALGERERGKLERRAGKT